MSMSNTFWNKIEQILLAEQISVGEFATLIDANENTLRNAKSRGHTPRWDFIQKIINRYPHYTLWLTIDKVEPTVGQVKPTPSNPHHIHTLWQIVDRVDSRHITSTVIKESEFKRIHFIQAERDPETLGAIIELVSSTQIHSTSKIRVDNVVWVEPGTMSFNSEHGGKLALLRFREKLAMIDFDLVLNSKLWMIEDSILSRAVKTLSFSVDSLNVIDTDTPIGQRFESWKCSKSPYL